MANGGAFQIDSGLILSATLLGCNSAAVSSRLAASQASAPRPGFTLLSWQDSDGRARYILMSHNAADSSRRFRSIKNASGKRKAFRSSSRKFRDVEGQVTDTSSECNYPLARLSRARPKAFTITGDEPTLLFCGSSSSAFLRMLLTIEKAAFTPGTESGIGDRSSQGNAHFLFAFPRERDDWIGDRGQSTYLDRMRSAAALAKESEIDGKAADLPAISQDMLTEPYLSPVRQGEPGSGHLAG